MTDEMIQQKKDELEFGSKVEEKKETNKFFDAKILTDKLKNQMNNIVKFQNKMMVNLFEEQRKEKELTDIFKVVYN